MPKYAYIGVDPEYQHAVSETDMPMLSEDPAELAIQTAAAVNQKVLQVISAQDSEAPDLVPPFASE